MKSCCRRYGYLSRLFSMGLLGMLIQLAAYAAESWADKVVAPHSKNPGGNIPAHYVRVIPSPEGGSTKLVHNLDAMMVESCARRGISLKPLPAGTLVSEVVWDTYYVPGGMVKFVSSREFPVDPQTCQRLPPRYTKEYSFISKTYSCKSTNKKSPCVDLDKRIPVQGEPYEVHAEALNQKRTIAGVVCDVSQGAVAQIKPTKICAIAQDDPRLHDFVPLKRIDLESELISGQKSFVAKKVELNIKTSVQTMLPTPWLNESEGRQ